MSNPYPAKRSTCSYLMPLTQDIILNDQRVKIKMALILKPFCHNSRIEFDGLMNPKLSILEYVPIKKCAQITSEVDRNWGNITLKCYTQALNLLHYCKFNNRCDLNSRIEELNRYVLNATQYLDNMEAS